jgi:hypothetical protein
MSRRRETQNKNQEKHNQLELMEDTIHTKLG